MSTATPALPLYKVLVDGKACHDGSYAYSVPSDTGPGEWTTPIDNVLMCTRGYHVTSDPMQWAKVGMQVFETEQRDLRPVLRGDKRVASSIRLVHERPDLVPSWWRDVERFVGSIAGVRFFQDPGEPDPAWRVFDTRHAAWAAARAAAWAAARAAAWDAARDAARDAAWAAAWATARAAAWAAARAAAWDAARDAAWDAAWATARDAALLARVLVCDGLGLDQRHIDHARARWAVWQRGYGLACDVDGVLYVFRTP